MFRAACFIGAQVKLSGALFYRVYQSLDQRTLRASPLRNFIDHRLAMLMQKFVRRQRRFPSLRYRKDVAQIRIRRKLGDRNFFPLRLLEVVKLRHRTFHVIDRDVGLPAPPWRVALPQLARQPVEVTQFLHRTPAAITLAPIRARRQPYRKRLCKIFVRMLLRIPSRQMSDIVARERRRTIIVAIRPAERTKQLLPLRRIVQPIRICKSVSGFVAQVHHDLSRILQVVRFLFQFRQRRVRQVKRNPNHRFSRRTSPLVGQVADGPKFGQSLGIELAIQLLNEALDRRTLQLQAELTNRPTK